jgi:DNA-binding NtrC family response regulator
MASPIILIIDDISEIVEEMIEMLALRDWPAIGARSIGEAVERLAGAPDIRIVISDVRVGPESGYGIIDRIERSGLALRNLSYIFMTGDLDAIDALPDRGDADVLIKPLDLRALIRRVGAMLDDH